MMISDRSMAAFLLVCATALGQDFQPLVDYIPYSLVTDDVRICLSTPEFLRYSILHSRSGQDEKCE